MQRNSHGMTIYKVDFFVSVYYKAPLTGCFLVYNSIGHATMETRSVEPVHKLSTFLPIVADLAYNKHMSNKLSKMITLEITIEEAKAYAEALDRALDNPFIQDDDECSPLFTLSLSLIHI